MIQSSVKAKQQAIYCMIDVLIWYILLWMDTSDQSQMPINQSRPFDLHTNALDKLSYCFREALDPCGVSIMHINSCPLMLNIYSASTNETARLVFYTCCQPREIVAGVYVNRSLLMKQREKTRQRKRVKRSLMSGAAELVQWWQEMCSTDTRVQSRVLIFVSTWLCFYILHQCKSFHTRCHL